MTHTLPLTLIDLTVTDNVTQARHELNRAIDRADEAALAAWARKWGGAALLAAEEGPDRDDDDFAFTAGAAASTDAAEAALSKLEERIDSMGQIIGRPTLDVSALAAALEDVRGHLSTAQEALANG